MMISCTHKHLHTIEDMATTKSISSGGTTATDDINSYDQSVDPTSQAIEMTLVLHHFTSIPFTHTGTIVPSRG